MNFIILLKQNYSLVFFTLTNILIGEKKIIKVKKYKSSNYEIISFHPQCSYVYQCILDTKRNILIFEKKCEKYSFQFFPFTPSVAMFSNIF